MKGIIFLSVLLIISARGLSQVSHLQVVSESGIAVFLDGKFKGTTSTEYGGLIIQNISSGQHTIKVVKEGYLPREESISVKAGEVFTYQVDKNFVPAIQITEQGNKDNQAISIKQGKLKIQSLPIGINIRIPALNINSLKAKDEWSAEPIPEGIYQAAFTLNEKVLSDALEIKNDMVTYIFVNMITGRIENKSIRPINSALTPDEESKDEKDLIQYSFTEREIVGDITFKKFGRDGVFSGNDGKLHKYKAQLNWGALNIGKYIQFWIDDKLVLDVKNSDPFNYYFVKELPQDPFFIISSIYSGNNTLIICKLQPYINSGTIPIPVSQKVLFQKRFPDYMNIRAWIYFKDSQDQNHNLNIIGFYKIKGGMRFDVYLDNAFVTSLPYKFNQGLLNYTLTSFSPTLQISIQGDKQNIYTLNIKRN